MQAPPKKKGNKRGAKTQTIWCVCDRKDQKATLPNLLNIRDEVIVFIEQQEKEKNSNFSGVENRIAPGYRRCSHGRPFVNNQVIK